MSLSFKQIENYIFKDLKGTLQKTIVICDSCKGEGIITSKKYLGHVEGYIFEHKACFACKGKGRLKEFRITWNEDF